MDDEQVKGEAASDKVKLQKALDMSTEQDADALKMSLEMKKLMDIRSFNIIS